MGVVSALFAYKVVAAARSPVDKPALLRDFGIDPDRQPEVSQIIADDDYYALLERLALAEDSGADFLVRVGSSMRCEDYGVFGMAWKAAPNLLGSFARAERYGRLLTNVTTYEVRSDADRVGLVLHREGGRRGLLMSNEASLASVITISREVSSMPLDPCEVSFAHEAFGPVARYEQAFGCPVRFGANRYEVTFERAVAERPNRLGDEAMSRFFNPLLDRELARVEVEPSFEDRIRMQISRSLSEGVPRMVDVARALGVSERTMHRRLADRNTSFKALAEQARQQLAESLLRQPRHSLAEVAFMTGFSEQSAFNRAFKRWVGQTPSAFRAAESR